MEIMIERKNEINSDYEEQQKIDRMCDDLYEEEQNKYKYWTTKDKIKIAVKEMTTRHIKNTIDMLERNGYIALSTFELITFEFYFYTSGPNGDIAQDDFEQECYETLHMTPTKWIDIFNQELKNRGKKND
jgi:hypothetical protein